MKEKIKKRFTAGFLAILIMFTTIFSGFTPQMATHAASRFRGTNIWTGGSEVMFGKKRNYMYRWTDGFQMTFCIDPGNHMSRDVNASATRYHIDDDNVPYLQSREDFERLALICDWFDTKAGSTRASNASYAAAQGAIWAIVMEDWDSADSIITTINKHIPGTTVKWRELESYVNEAGLGSSGLPKWCSIIESQAPQLNMTLVDGEYKIDLDITGYPEMASIPWELPDSNWSKTVAGNTLSIVFKGSREPQRITIKGKAPESMNRLAKNSQFLVIYTPDHAKDQAMIGAGAQPATPILYFSLNGVIVPPESSGPTVEIFRHRETFESHYNMDLQKYCAETGQTLQGSTFAVLEAFDVAQVMRPLSLTNMTPKPASWNGCKECTQIQTDESGQASHRDTKFYQYNKTYCGGHPEPEYLEVPEVEIDPDTGEATNAEEIAAAEAENERLKAEWEALVELCEEETDFHSEEEGEALDIMLSDRDDTYEQFISLKYDYTVKELDARYGYILHGQHNDDEVIPVIRIGSSESGADSEVIARNVIENKTLIPRSSLAVPKQVDSSIVAREIWEGIGYSLEESRSIIKTATKSNAERFRVASDSAADWMDPEDLNDGNYQYDLFKREYQSEIIWEKATTDHAMFRLSREDVNVSLPEPEDDDESVITPWGDKTKNAYTFQVNDRRTEGEIHINKRDLELYDKDSSQDKEGSYGQAQGDAALEGAVYGLYAAADIIHPDGKTGKVFAANDLVAIGTTDLSGDASFLVITEESETSLSADNRAGTWIGHPLFLGNYYIKEISRSEGYELSVHGINLTESNRSGTGGEILTPAGSASAGRLEHPIDNHDGSWNEFEVRNFKTENGFDIVVSGYPEGTTFFTTERKEHTTTENVVIGTVRTPTGEFEKAAAGEKKLDASGNYIPVLDADGKPVYDLTSPLASTYFTYYRLNVYPNGTAAPEVDPEKWADTTTVDSDYIQEETNAMLHQVGFRVLDEVHGDGAPWTVLNLVGTTNQEIVEEVLDWYTANNFWDSAAVHSIFEDNGNYKAVIFHDYKAVIATSIYDPLNQSVYVRKDITVNGGAGSSHMFIRYPIGNFTLRGSYATVSPSKEVTGEILLLDNMEDYLEEKFQPLYEIYSEGDIRLDRTGQPIEIYQTEFIYGDEEQTITDYELTQVAAEYDAAAGTYTIRVENTTDWTGITEPEVTTYRAVTTKKKITIDGEEMFYSDYLTQVIGAGAAAYTRRDALDTGSYICFQNLVYPGQIPVHQDGGTRVRPVLVMQRVIKQAVKVTKDVSRESYEENNTYRIHRDPFTVLFGGFLGAGKKFVSGFHFKLYRVAELEATGLLEKNEDGSNNYKKFFAEKENDQLFLDLAISWDKPEKDIDGDLATLHAVLGNGNEAYYGESIMLPYGTYVIVEQIPTELVNKHYELDDPKEVEIPFVPDMNPDGTATDQPSRDYLYFADYTPEELMDRFKIRFNEEIHVIQAHNNDGDFEVYKYGLDQDLKPDPYGNPAVAEYYRWNSTSEDGGTANQVYYDVLYSQDGTVLGYGEQLDGVPTMTGKSTAMNGKYAKALVPWSVLDPRTGAVIDDEGNVGNRGPGLDAEGKFNFISFNNKHFENTFYSSKLRVEKLDSETGENIIHDGALFKIYAASRDVAGVGRSDVAGTGNVLYVTENVTGTRSELEARGDIDGITWDTVAGTYTGTVTRPVYDENELITMIDRTGAEVGIFRAFSTEREVVEGDGTVSKEKVGYIETYQPLGAGVYVLVEVQAPDGYQKSRPIAFEVYKDRTTYYEEGDPNRQTEAERYQYVKPFNGTDELVYEDMARVKVTDYPSKLYIHKVEDGDRQIGDINVLDGLRNVNDKGDVLTYEVRGRLEYLEARGDVEHIIWDAERQEYAGIVTKTYQEWSESVIAGTEAELLAMENVKPLYEIGTEAFTGFGIRFGINVVGAELTLLKGLPVQKTATGYRGIEAVWEGGKVIKIIAHETGNHLKITTNERDQRPPYLNIWDTESIRNKPANVFFYNMDSDSIRTERDERTGETWILDEGENRICFADPVTGMAYTYDDYGTMIVYVADESGNKVTAQSIEVHNNGEKDHIYVDVDTTDDELGFPLYYNSGEVTYKNEIWVSDGTPHEINRLPFGAYILEESGIPYDQGYIKAPDMAFILRESSEEQHYYFQNEFTKINVAKVDITTKAEIQDAGMTLYRAEKIPDDSEKGYYLEKGEVYTDWISGYQYDDNGSLKLIWNDEKIATSEPHWIDHIPYGYYLLEESRVPYEWGYVQSDPAEIYVSESGNVQTFLMEDDYTAVEIKKLDTNTGEVLDNDHKATLGLYQASLDQEGNPIFKETRDIPGKTIPVYDPAGKIVVWETEDGLDVAATGRQVTDEYGVTRTVYDYEIQYVPVTLEMRQAQYYITENGTTRFEYLPVGHYVLVEESTPIGYATALPMLITVEDTGSREHVQYYEMEDKPLTLDVSKSDAAGGGKEVNGAHMSIYPVIEGEKADSPAYTWISGSNGRFKETDQEDGTMPFGYQVGDIRPHRITYIPAGTYILVEETTPYGFLQAVEIPFTVMDTGEIQGIQMVDEIPVGALKVIKHDSEDDTLLLSGAVFRLKNQTLNQEIETVTTDDHGTAEFAPVPIGYMNKDGNFLPYTYLLTEINAPQDYMLNPTPYEFQFQYSDAQTAIIHCEYQAEDKLNQVKISKKILTNQEELSGARMMVVGKYTKNIVDQWISTGQPHYINGIVAGEYTLIESVTPGGGYALAESIDFSITDNMTEVPYIVMYDKPTETEIRKTEGNSDRLLPGARMQLSGADGTVLYEWVTTDHPYTVYGLEPGIYILKELEAPSGYVLGPPMQIRVEDSYEVQLFKYANHKKSTGGGQPDREWILLRKFSTDGTFLQGAVFTCYRPDGSTVATVESDSKGFIRIPKPEPGTYLLKEIKAPPGFFVQDKIFWFTVNEDGSVSGDYRIVNTPAPQIELEKRDGETDTPLSGAALCVYDEAGNIVAEGMTKEEGMFCFTAPAPGTFTAKEVEAPEGYVRSEGEWLFTVGMDGTVSGNTVIYNLKTPSRKKIGIITAFYGSGNKGRHVPGTDSEDRYVPGAKTGDETGYEWYLTLRNSFAVICFAMTAWFVLRAKRKEKSNEPND